VQLKEKRNLRLKEIMKKQNYIFILLLILLTACSTKKAPTENKSLRLVALSPAMSEVLDLLCPDSIIVGRTELGTFSEGLQKKPVITTYPKLDLEALLKLKPSHVFTSKGMTNPDLIKRLKDFGVEVYEAQNTSLEAIFNSFEEIGEISGCAKRGVFIKDSLNNVLSSFAFSKKWSCLGVISVDPMYVYGGNTYFTDIIKKLGGENLVEQENYPIIDKELFLRFNPEKIITTDRKRVLEYYSGRNISKALNIMNDTTAIIEVNADWLSRPNHNILKAMKQIESQL
jgi:iron complex transport system substrate-binding protein